MVEFADMSDKLWKEINTLWKEGENKSVYVKDMLDYYNGVLKSSGWEDWKVTPTNVVKKVVDTIHSNVLDAQFTMHVVPVLNSFSDVNSIKVQQDVADIFNDEMHNVLNQDQFDTVKSKVNKWGLIAGFGAGQTFLDTNEDVEGRIRHISIEPGNLRWNKGANCLDDVTFFAYKTTLNPYIAKKRYACKDGKWDEELCKKIDEVSDSYGTIEKGQRKGIVNIQSTETSGQAFSYDSDGVVAGQTVELIVMFLLDDTLYAPKQGESDEEKSENLVLQEKYPNGRMIVFSPKENKKLVLDDKPAPEGFKGLGNIDIFNPSEFNDLTGRSVEYDLIGIQERINGCWKKVRYCIQNHIRTVGADDQLDNMGTDSDFVNHAITYVEGAGNDPAKAMPMISNELLMDIKPLLDTIIQLKQEANEIARINETMATGERQPGTTSGEQVEQLQESPMSSIREKQRAFKNYVIRVGGKIITLIQEHYTVQRLVKLSTGIVDGQNTYKTARITTTPPEQGQEPVIELLTEAGEAAKTIKLNRDWKFSVEVVAGTEIPRSRRETANLMNQLFANGTLTNSQIDLDVLEMYLKSIDMPNYRSIIKELKRKRDTTPAPKMPRIEVIMQSKEMMQGFADMIKGMGGFSQAIGAVLQGVGLIPEADTLTDAPIQSVTAKSGVEKVASVVPSKVSNDPDKAEYGNNIAQIEQILNNLDSQHIAAILNIAQAFNRPDTKPDVVQ